MERVVRILILQLVFLAWTVPGQKYAKLCNAPLGMEEGIIPDGAISASSTYEAKSVGPQNARIRNEKNGGAWCPKAQISSDVREYLEIDLTRNHLITWTETQGRFGNGEGQEFAEAFSIEYTRGTNSWHHYKNIRGQRIQKGNKNTYIAEKQRLELPFAANRIRFIPYSKHPRTVCMRVEIYGCIWEPDIVSYSIPFEDSQLPGGQSLLDSSYDGIRVNFSLVQGLGQLTDNIIADPSELLIGTKDKETNWLGWSNRQSVQLIFAFKETRKFDSCIVHVAHQPDSDIQIFSTAQAWFSLDEKEYKISTSEFVISNGTKSNASFVQLPLELKTGRNVKLVLKLAAKFLLISEVTFYSEVIHEYENESSGIEEIKSTVTTTIKLEEMTIDTAFELEESSSILVYVGLFGSLSFLILAIVISCTIFFAKQRGRNKVALLQKHRAQTVDTRIDEAKQNFVYSNRLSSSSSSGACTDNESYYAATDILTIKRREERNNSSLFTTLEIHKRSQDSSFRPTIERVSRHRLRILDKFGEGSFGLVYLCEAKAGTFRSSNRRQVVIVRSLWRGVSDTIKKDFAKDMQLLDGIYTAGPGNENLARMSALMDEEEPMGAVFEYAELGELSAFMKSDNLSLSYGSLLSFLRQIASGMKYLENLGIGHRDLAARNCILDKNLFVKISDHAIFCSRYEHEYYINGQYLKVPLRWMSWESALLESSGGPPADVWSFGVICFEIFNYCCELPYQEFTNEQVLDNYSRWLDPTTAVGQVLRQPALCPREIYRLMQRCWSTRPEDRPTFQEIYLFLARLDQD